MVNFISARKRVCLTTMFAVGVTLVSANLANARNNHQQNNSQNNGAKPHFVISGQPASAKKVIHERKKEKHAENKKEKQAEKKKKGCEKIIVPTAECGVSRKDPVGKLSLLSHRQRRPGTLPRRDPRPAPKQRQSSMETRRPRLPMARG
jgi:hypothetical protein